MSLPLTRQQKERVEIAEPVERVEDLHSVPMEKRSGGGGWDGMCLVFLCGRARSSV